MKKKNQMVPVDGRRDMALWDPFNNMKDFQSLFTDFFDRFWGRNPLLSVSQDLEGGSAWMPAVDIREDDKGFRVDVEVPGIDRKNIQVKVEDSVLTIEGERKSEKKTEAEHSHRIERAYGSFQRSFKLPESVDGSQVKAEYKDGLLHLEVPKREDVKPKRIDVQVN